jgi:acyl transferase domain-containing protein
MLLAFFALLANNTPAGIPIEKISNSNTSAYTGNLADDYKFLTSHDIEENGKYQLMGMTGLLSGRISWFFNLKGPNFTIDTACSSSLVALDVGCQSLHSKSADMVSSYLSWFGLR